MEKQMDLLKRQDGVLQQVPLTDLLTRRREQHAPPPTPALFRQIEAFGFERAIRLTLMPDDTYFVRAGLRGVEALAQLAEHGTEPYCLPEYKVWAYVRQWSGPEDLIASIADNEVTRPNHMAMFEAVEELALSMSESQIAQVTGMPVQRAKKYLKLRRLSPGLRDGFLSGEISYSAADRLSGMDETRQGRAADLLDEKGKVTGKDVEVMRRITVDDDFNEFMQQVEMIEGPQYWPLIVDRALGTVTIIAPDRAHYVIEYEVFVGMLEELSEKEREPSS